jgi:Cdc6-like AAA superfamily ATPase
LQQDIDRAEGRLQPLLVALYGGPGTGKSTTASLVFGALKQHGHNVELVHEVAKDLTWEQRHRALAHQPYVAAKQMFRYDRLHGQVDAIITDTSTMLSLIYSKSSDSPLRDLAFHQWIVADWRARRTLNVFLRRNIERPYNPKGRSQSEIEAQNLDLRIKDMLDAYELPCLELNMSTTTDHVEQIVTEVESELA